ncbi:MAG: Surface layer protein precursor [Firmicutes bacterium ADurb.Bin193]|nr:MAG: Surface layer protein precursor [Firmicutes bacterium ADurb.Bin193]
MKNLKKALALVVSLTMLMGTVVFAGTFSDVQDSHAYAEAIELGVALKLYTGYEDGSFKPEGDITRAEFAAIVVRMLGQEDQAEGAKGATKFTDVASTDWAAGYINIASSLGIINGYGDGTFGPNDNVTYEQAVKMVVVALGYELAAGGNYPVGYLTIAQQNGITTGVKGVNGVKMNRGQVAQLVYNALDVPIMEQTGFGTFVDYVINDGSGDTYRKTLMTEKLGVVKLAVSVNESYELSNAKKANLVKVTIDKAYGNKYADEDYDDDRELAAGKGLEIDVGTTNLKSFLGTKAVVYMAYDENSDDKPVALYTTKYTGTTDEITIARSNIDDITTDDTTISSNTVFKVKYYETNNATKTSTFKIRNNANVYINGYKDDSNASVKTLIKAAYGVIRFVLEDTDDDEVDYDKIFITSYKHMVVDSVNVSTGRAKGKEGDITTIIFDKDDDRYSTTLVDKSGKPVEWSSVKENDVIAIQERRGDRTVSVCTLLRDVVTGEITESRDISVTDFNPDPNGKIYTIGGKDYKVNPYYADSKIKLGAEGTFYLDIAGRIVYFDGITTAKSDYAFIIAAGEAGTLDKVTQIKMITFKGEVKTFEVASKVNVSYTDGTTYEENEQVNDEDLLDDTKPYALKDNSNNTIKQLVTFGLNSSGKINKLVFPNTLETGKADTDYLTLYKTDTSATYDLDKKKFTIDGTSVYFDDLTIILQAPGTDDEDDYKIIPLSALVEDAAAWDNVSAYDVNSDKVASLILVESDVDLTSGATGIAMVISKSSKKNDSGVTVQKLTAIQNNKTVELLGDSNSIFNSISTGDIIVPQFNSKNEVNGFEVIASIDLDSEGKVTGNITEAPGFDDGVYVKGDNRYTFSKVIGKKGSRIELEIGEDLIIKGDVSIYAYIESGNGAANKAVIPALGYDVFDIDDGVYYDASYDEIAPVYVLYREYDEELKEVVFFLFDER